MRGNVKTKGILLFAAAAAVCMVLSQGAQARNLEQIKADGKIIVATEGSYPPFNYYQGDKLTGFDVDLAEAIARKLGLKVEWKAARFDGLMSGLRQDRWDLVMASLGINDSRAKDVTFTAAQYCSSGVIMSKDPKVSSAGSLAGKAVAVQSGTSYVDFLKTIPGIKEVKTFPENKDAQSALQAGLVDAWVTDRLSVKAVLAANPKSGLKQSEYLFNEKIAGAVKKNNDALAKAVDTAVADLMADGTYKALSEQYFKEDVRCR